MSQTHPEDTSSPAPSGTVAEDEKPTVPNGTIMLRVISSEGSEVVFKVRSSTPLRKIFTAYCDRVGKELDSVRFLFDGQRIVDDQTPDGMGMEDGDVIDVMVAQTGGDSGSPNFAK